MGWGNAGWPAFSFQIRRVEYSHDTSLKACQSIQGVKHTGTITNGLSVVAEINKCAELVPVKAVCQLLVRCVYFEVFFSSHETI